MQPGSGGAEEHAMPDLKAFLGRQPILDRGERVVGYELLFRSAADATRAVFDEQNSAAARVIVNTFTALGADAVLGDGLGFFNVTAEVLRTDVLEALPPERVVIEILENVEDHPAVLRRCRALRERGFRLALDDWCEKDPRIGLLEIADLVKVDLLAVPPGRLRRVVRQLRRREVGLVAEKVESREDFRRCRDLGFDYFQGFFFARPVVLEGVALDPGRAALLELLQKIQAEAETAEIVEVMKLHVNLGLNLLRLVNSAALPKPNRIERVEDAIHYLGRQHLQRWIAILLFAGGDRDGVRSPLLLAAAHRGRLLELLAWEGRGGAVSADRAFLAGMLSFLDALLRRPLAEVLGQLHLHEDLRRALLHREGALGELLEVAELAMNGDAVALEPRLAPLGLDLEGFQRAEQAAFVWVHDLRTG